MQQWQLLVTQWMMFQLWLEPTVHPSAVHYWPTATMDNNKGLFQCLARYWYNGSKSDILGKDSFLRTGAFTVRLKSLLETLRCAGVQRHVHELPWDWETILTSFTTACLHTEHKQKANIKLSNVIVSLTAGGFKPRPYFGQFVQPFCSQQRHLKAYCLLMHVTIDCI